MWIDDKISADNKNKNYFYYCDIQYKAFEHNLHFILKQSSDSAMAFIKSPLFKASL